MSIRIFGVAIERGFSNLTCMVQGDKVQAEACILLNKRKQEALKVQLVEWKEELEKATGLLAKANPQQDKPDGPSKAGKADSKGRAGASKKVGPSAFYTDWRILS